MLTRCNAQTKTKQRCGKTYKSNNKYCHVHQKVIRNGKRVFDYIEPVEVPELDDENHNNDEMSEEFEELKGLENMVLERDRLLKSVRKEKKIGNLTYIIEIQNLEEEIEEEINEIKSECKIECKICYLEYDSDDIIHCGIDDHTSCVGCTQQYITHLINEKKQIKCMFDSTEKCGHLYSEESILMCCGKNINLFDKYLEYRKVDQATQIASVVDNYHICPFCSKWGIIVENQFPDGHPQNIKNLTCGDCGTMFCIRCRKAYHGNDTCNRIYHPNKDMVRKTIDRVIDDAIIHNCPKCYTKYAKEDGCNLMSCPSCKTNSCYLCNKITNPRRGQKYWHFSSDKGKCPLYNHKGLTDSKTVTKGNTTFNNKKVIEALKKLVVENMDNQKVKKMIYADVKKRGYKL
jgi:IBR (half RING finger) domain-containing protein